MSLGAVSAIMIPACTIRIGKGGEREDNWPTPDDTQPAPDDTQPAPDDTQPAPDDRTHARRYAAHARRDAARADLDDGVGDSTTFTPEEEAAIDAAHNADPGEFALMNAKATYAAYALSGLTEVQFARSHHD